MNDIDIQAFFLGLLLMSSAARADDLDEVMQVPEAERPNLIASKLDRYTSLFSSSIFSFSTVETGTVPNHIKREGEIEPSSSVPINGRWVSEYVLSADKRYTKSIQPDGEAIGFYYDGKRGTQYHYDHKNEMVSAVQFCSLPPLFSMTARNFVGITGITTFNHCSKEDWIGLTRILSWGERIMDPKLGDCIVLKQENSRDNFGLDRQSVYYGIRDSTIVILRRESLSQSQSSTEIHGKPALHLYKWLFEFEYGKSTGKLLPESWNHVISSEFCSLDGRLLPLGGLLQKNPGIIQATKTKLSQCKFLDKFPPELENIPVGPRTKLSNSCAEKEQVQIAEKQKSNWSSSFWLLGLCIVSCSIAAFAYLKSRRS